MTVDCWIDPDVAVTVTLNETGFEPPPVPPPLPPATVPPPPPPQLDIDPKEQRASGINNAVHQLFRLIRLAKHNANAIEVPSINGWPWLRVAADCEKLKTVNGVVTGVPETVTNGANA